MISFLLVVSIKIKTYIKIIGTVFAFSLQIHLYAKLVKNINSRLCRLEMGWRLPWVYCNFCNCIFLIGEKRLLILFLNKGNAYKTTINFYRARTCLSTVHMQIGIGTSPCSKNIKVPPGVF